jgi:hypothetical protein
MFPLILLATTGNFVSLVYLTRVLSLAIACYAEVDDSTTL